MYPKIEKIVELMPDCKEMIIKDDYFLQVGFEDGNWSSDGDGDYIQITDDRIELGLFEDRIKEVKRMGKTLIITVERMI